MKECAVVRGLSSASERTRHTQLQSGAHAPRATLKPKNLVGKTYFWGRARERVSACLVCGWVFGVCSCLFEVRMHADCHARTATAAPSSGMCAPYVMLSICYIYVLCGGTLTMIWISPPRERGGSAAALTYCTEYGR